MFKLNELQLIYLAFNSLSAMICFESTATEVILMKQTNLMKLVDFLEVATCNIEIFRNIHKPLVDLLSHCIPLCQSFARSVNISTRFVRWLSLTSEAAVLCSLIRIIQLLFNHSFSQRQYLIDYQLYELIKKLSASRENQVLVYQMASKLMLEFDFVMKSSFAGTTTATAAGSGGGN